ncbi:CBS domain-containing protein [Shewanella sp. GXUN23E]|uniref:CBS domain-containing protein n=1 Tax=Shewanella sp. GXUN23E TaxID=3422498 RepID=UPI003D7E61A7
MSTIKQIMTTKVLTLQMDDRLELAHQLLEQMSFHHLVITEAGKVVGVLSQRDIFRALSPKLGMSAQTDKDLSCLNIRLHQLMSRHPITVEPHTNLQTAAAILLEHGIGCLPVTSGDGQLVGLITWKDLLAAFIHQPAPCQ